jgi:hypothetical protein
VTGLPAPAAIPGGARRLALAAILLLVAVVSWLAREGYEQRLELPGDRWGTIDPDTYYHLRRVDRTLTEGLPPAGTDPYLNFPDGAAIPWPPYYTVLGWMAASPGAPADAEARRIHVEQRVASMPHAIGTLTSVAVGAAGAMLAGPVGALIAGGNHALSHASLFYSRAGNGDHHAWVSLLTVLTLLLLGAGLARGAADRPGTGAVWGAMAGAVTGVSLGSWVGSTLHVLPVQAMFGAMIVANGFRARPGLAAFGGAFHVAALITLLPAAATSPWNDVQPGSVVNLSWFHVAWLGIGAMVFAPLAFVRGGTRTARIVPVVVALVLGGVGLWLARSDAGLAAALREGFGWLGREDEFMGSVWESRGVGLHEAGILLGRLVYLLPFVVAAAAWAIVRRGRWELLPWTFAAPFLALEMARQYRFAEPLSGPWSVLLAWGIVAGARSDAVRSRLIRLGVGVGAGTAGRSRILSRAAAPVGIVLILILLPLTNRQSVRESIQGLRGRAPAADALSRVVRDLCEWIRLSTPATGTYAVLSDWNFGHAVEWVADRPTVGTNFGIYVGEDSFRDAGRFFLSDDPVRAAALLERRHVRYVLETAWQPRFLGQMVRAVAPGDASRFLATGPDGAPQLRPDWFRTMGARLLFNGSVVGTDGSVGPPLDFLRAVRVSPERFPDAMFNEIRPAGWVWERVPGAIVAARGSPGDTLQVQIQVRYPSGDDLVWWGEALVDADGVAALRVPYATDVPNGDGVAGGPARVRVGGRAMEVEIPEEAVLRGGTLRLP